VATSNLGLRLDIDIRDLSIELVSLPNRSYIYCIELQFEFHCLDDFVLPSEIHGNIPIQFMLWM
jgi:hypothetical protein